MHHCPWPWAQKHCVSIVALSSRPCASAPLEIAHKFAKMPKTSATEACSMTTAASAATLVLHVMCLLRLMWSAEYPLIEKQKKKIIKVAIYNEDRESAARIVMSLSYSIVFANKAHLYAISVSHICQGNQSLCSTNTTFIVSRTHPTLCQALLCCYERHLEACNTFFLHSAQTVAARTYISVKICVSACVCVWAGVGALVCVSCTRSSRVVW